MTTIALHALAVPLWFIAMLMFVASYAFSTDLGGPDAVSRWTFVLGLITAAVAYTMQVLA